MAGGVAKGFGVVFIVLGSLGIVVGLVTAAFGAYVVNEEENKGFFGDQGDAEAGAMLGIGGLGVAGIGLVLLLLGIMLYAIGAGQARRELMVTVAGARGGAAASGEEWTRAPAPPQQAQAPTPTVVTLRPLPPPAETPQAPVAPARVAPAPIRRRETRTPWGIIGGVVAAAVVVLLLLMVFQPGLRGADGDLGQVREPEVREYTGTVQGFRTPLGPQSVTGSSHLMTTDLSRGVVRGSLNWTAASPAAPATLELVLSARQGEVWTEIARGQGGPGFVVESPASVLDGEVRAMVYVGGEAGGSADQPYTLTLTILPID